MLLKEQNYICTVAEFQSVTAAASQLRISQSALTQAIQAVEKSLGTKLFDRVGKRMIPTAAGRLYVAKARQMLVLKTEFHQELQDMTRNYAEQIRVGVQDLYSDRVCPPLLQWFLEEFPMVKMRPVERRLAELEQKMLDNEVDLCFVNLFNDPTRRFEQIPLVSEHTVLAVPKNDPLLKTARTWPCPGSPYPYIDLKPFEERQFILSPTLYRDGYDAETLLKSLDVSPARVVNFQRVASILRMTALGDAVCLTLPRYVRMYGLQDQLELFELDALRKETVFGAIYLRGKELPDYSQLIIDKAAEIYKAI